MSGQRQRRSANRRLLVRMLLVAAGMFGFGFALIPLYNVFCDITGLNGKTANAASNVEFQIDESRTVTVEFLASLNESMPWEFRPVVHKMRVHPGQAYSTEFTARNRSGKDMVGQAVPSVAPGRAASYFHKTECFCFTQQKLAKDEQRSLPLRFAIDPALPKDISTVSLSYTFFAVDG
jgi:cytochrome c oxidase assembly protein subunit 11